MAGWGAMIGLGQGLQQVSGMMLDNHKSKMKEQLEIEKENRAVARQEARDALEESRKLATPTDWQTLENPDGTLARQGVNYLGKPIADALMPMSNIEAEEFRRKRDKEDTESEIKSLELTLKQGQVDNVDSERERKARLEEARIQSEHARAGSYSRANTGASRSGADKPAPTKADVETAVYDRYKSLIDETKKEYGVSEVAIQSALARAVENEARLNLPYGSTFQKTLTELIQDKRSKVSTVKSGTK